MKVLLASRMDFTPPVSKAILGGEVSLSNPEIFPAQRFSAEVSSSNPGVFPARNFSGEVSPSRSADFSSTSAGHSVCLGVSTFDPTLFYVDSGAGQCMCSSDEAFINMSPCEIEISGVAGSLQIYGIGTALFVVQDGDGNEVIMRVHNCLFSQGDFTLISVSQVCGKPGNSVDLSLDSASLNLMSSGPKRRRIKIPLYLDDGLFAAKFDAIQVDDPRYAHLPKCDVTPGGEFTLASSETGGRWRSKVLLSASKSARILVAKSHDYHWNLESFCGNFLAPPSLPPVKQQYDGTDPSALTDLSIRFFGVGT